DRDQDEMHRKAHPGDELRVQPLPAEIFGGGVEEHERGERAEEEKDGGRRRPAIGPVLLQVDSSPAPEHDPRKAEAAFPERSCSINVSRPLSCCRLIPDRLNVPPTRRNLRRIRPDRKAAAPVRRALPRARPPRPAAPCPAGWPRCGK